MPGDMWVTITQPSGKADQAREYPAAAGRPGYGGLAAAAGQKPADPRLVLAGDERPGHRHQDLVGVGQACPDRVPRGVGELHLGPLSARRAVDVADLAHDRRSATGLDQGRGLLQQGEMGAASSSAAGGWDADRSRWPSRTVLPSGSSSFTSPPSACGEWPMCATSTRAAPSAPATASRSSK